MTQNQGYIYILKEDTHFALTIMGGNAGEEYVTLLDYENTQEVNFYFDSDSDSDTEKYLHPFNISKFYKIPVKKSDNPFIEDLLDFTRKEK